MNWVSTLVGDETLVLFAIVGLSLILLLSALKFDLAVLVCFCLLGIVRIEPAPVDALAMILLLVGLLTGRLSFRALRGSSLVHFVLWIFLVANIASLTVTETFSDSLRFLMTTVYLIAFTYFVKMYVTSLHAMRILMLGYLVSAAINTLLVVLGYLGINPFSELFLQSGIRAVGAFKDPNVFGPFCVPVILLLIDEILYPQYLPRFFLAKVLGVVALTAAVFLSFSRAAWANLALAVTIYFLLNANRVLQIRLSSLLKGGAVTLLVAVFSVPVLKRILVGEMGLKEFLAWRISLQDYDLYRFNRQREGIEAGLTHLVGVGPGAWDYAHNLYVRSFAEHGILGLVSILALFAVLLTGLFRRALAEVSKPYGLSARVLLACLAGLALNSIVIDTIHWRHLWLIFALAWAVCTDRGPDLLDQRIGSPS